MSSFMERINKTRPTRAAEPTARIFINGLAILCFSQHFNRAEVGFLNVSDHPLLFNIYDKRCVPILPNPAGIEIFSGTGININSEPDHAGLGYLYYPNPTNDNDFRRLINIDQLHAEFFDTDRVKIKPNPFFAKMYINNGIFFNAELSKKESKFYTSSKEKEKERVGKVIGADIEDASIKIVLSSDINNPITLTNSAGRHPYRIVIRYKCERVASDKTDFERFYDVLTLPSTKHKKLKHKYKDIEEPEPLMCEEQFIKMFREDPQFKEKVKNNELLGKLARNADRAREACEGSTKPDCPENLQNIPEDCPIG